MDKYKLAEWMHDNYEQLAKAENWQTQEITRVKFEDLPAENKSTMLALADKMLNTFLIIADQANVSGWVAYDWNNIDSRPKVYGKYFVHRKDGKVHWETWNGSGWAYNENVITHWQEVKPPCH